MGCYNQANQPANFGYNEIPQMGIPQEFPYAGLQPPAAPGLGNIGMPFQHSTIGFPFWPELWGNSGSQIDDVPKQARVRRQRPPSSTEPKSKVDILSKSYTILATPFASTPKVGILEQSETEDSRLDHEKFDTITLALGTKPGSNKPPKILISLKTPKVLDAKMNTGTVSTQVFPFDLGPTVAIAEEEIPPDSAMSKKRKKSKKSRSRSIKSSAKSSKKAGAKKGKPKPRT